MTSALRYAAVLIMLLLAGNLYAQTPAPDTAWYGTGGAWSPYLAGALIGVLAWLTFYVSEQPIGASSFYATVAGLIGKVVASEHTRKLAYYRENPPKIGWEFAFVIAIVFGSALAATLGGEFAVRGLPRLWTDHYGVDSGFRYAALSFTGGMLMAFGARLAGGCT
ncbi:MAG: YeeE/YedE thiosulfate transporter family protein, partial [Nitrospira sp.]